MNSGVTRSSPEIGAQPEIQGLPLIGVTSEPPDRGNAILIAAARSETEHITHSVDRPNHVWLERTDDGADAALEIEAADGSKTILSFTQPARPEDVR